MATNMLLQVDHPLCQGIWPGDAAVRKWLSPGQCWEGQAGSHGACCSDSHATAELQLLLSPLHHGDCGTCIAIHEFDEPPQVRSHAMCCMALSPELECNMIQVQQPDGQ